MKDRNFKITKQEIEKGKKEVKVFLPQPKVDRAIKYFERKMKDV